MNSHNSTIAQQFNLRYIFSQFKFIENCGFSTWGRLNFSYEKELEDQIKVLYWIDECKLKSEQLNLEGEQAICD